MVQLASKKYNIYGNSKKKKYYQNSGIKYCLFCNNILDTTLTCDIHGYLGYRRKSWCTPELHKAMDNVRVRDSGMCQWYGCKATTNIHVHHIFPRYEYPELIMIERYMICYCAMHHKLWHTHRGDRVSMMI